MVYIVSVAFEGSLIAIVLHLEQGSNGDAFYIPSFTVLLQSNLDGTIAYSVHYIYLVSCW